MPDVFVVSDNILSPLGATTADNFSKLAGGVSGVKRHGDQGMSAEPFYAALFDREEDFIKDAIPESDGAFGDGGGGDGGFIKGPGDRGYTKFERLLIGSIRDALKNSGIDTSDERTALIISSTKGNIELLESRTTDPGLRDRIALHTSARLVAEYFGFVHPAIVVSTACISGIAAILTGMRLIKAGRYENIIIAGADTLSKFVLSGFQSFQAISGGPCRPFDRARDGINLGEGAGTIILSSNREYAAGKYAPLVRVLGGSISNDANHLSAPSRTGKELCTAITRSLNDSGLSPNDIDFISAHGTATVYNDEMEAKAITLAGLQQVPVNSLKGYYGHTLGAAGLIESIVSLHSLRENLVLPTLGFEEMGVSAPLNICTRLQPASLKNCLKTASGFGGCNAALVLGKE
jgi:3-oxoacyl-[acyl-carrier-protein] synthase-1